MADTRKWHVVVTAEFSTYEDALEFAEHCESMTPVIDTEILPMLDD